MNWEDILKKPTGPGYPVYPKDKKDEARMKRMLFGRDSDELRTITNELINPLEDYINSNWTPDGEYDEEKDGYYNADNQSNLYISYPDVEIIIEPDVDTDGLVREMDLYFKDTRLGSYTGSSGFYMAIDEWKDYNLDDLKELLEALEGE